MGLLLAVVFFACAIITYYQNRKRFMHSVVMSLLWGIIMLFESMHLFGLYKSDDITYCVIGVGVLAFLLGSLCSYSSILKIKATNNDEEYSVNSKRLYVFYGVTILLLGYPAINNIIALQTGISDMSIIRSTFSNIYKNKILALTYNYVALPFSGACLALASVIIFDTYDKKYRLIIMIMTAVVIVERVFIDAGRGILIYFLSMVIFSYHFKKNKRAIGKKGKKIILVVTMATIIAYIAITLARGGAVGTFLKHIYVYICGCVPFLNANIQEVNQSGTYLYGAGGLHGPLQFIFTMLENIGFNYPQFMKLSDSLYKSALQVRTIGTSLTFNAYATAFYNTYLDGGIVAVGIEMFLYGMLLRLVYNRFCCNNRNIRIKAIYMYLLYGVLFSFIRFQFALVNHCIVYVLIMFIIQKKELTNDSSTNKYRLR